MHSSLAITLAGLPLGLAANKFWTRKQFKGCDALKRRINPNPGAGSRREGKLSLAGELAPVHRTYKQPL